MVLVRLGDLVVYGPLLLTHKDGETIYRLSLFLRCYGDESASLSLLVYFLHTLRVLFWSLVIVFG